MTEEAGNEDKRIDFLKSFILQFTDSKIFDEKNIVQFGSEFYTTNSEMKKTSMMLSQKMGKVPIYAGTYLGRTGAKRFIPSIWLLQKISRVANTKIFVGEKAEWLFICGRNIWSKSVDKIEGKPAKGELVLVHNLREECLGYGRIIGNSKELEKSKVFLERIFDIGDLLRRERVIAKSYT